MDAARRRHVLDAMGVTLYARRAAARAVGPGGTGTALPRLVLVGRPEDRAAAEAVLQALGLAVAATQWVDASGEALSASPPAAQAYLALGDGLARPLGAELSTEVQRGAQIVVTPPPAQWRSAAGKRALWQVLKPLRRHLGA
jgi:hypothetical protein